MEARFLQRHEIVRPVVKTKLAGGLSREMTSLADSAYWSSATSYSRRHESRTQ